MNRLWRQDLVWAGLILVIAAALGLYQGLQLIPISKGLWQLQKNMDARQAQHQEVKSIGLAQAYDLFRQGQALFIDARPADEYVESHIPRSLNLSSTDLAKGAEKVIGITKNREIIVYCNSVSCDQATMVADQLENLGFSQVMIFVDGMGTWEKAGYPMEKAR